MAAPTLTYDPPTQEIRWTWEAADPAEWAYYSSTTENGSYTLVDIVAGGERSTFVDETGVWYKVRGLDLGEQPVTGFSNAVLSA